MGKCRYKPQKDARHGFYFIHLQVDNKRKYFGLGNDYKQAQAKLTALLRKRDRGELFGAAKSSVRTNDNGFKDIALRELAHRHLEWCEHNTSEGTYKQRKNYVNQFLRFLKKQPDNISWVSQVTLPLLDDYYVFAKNICSSSNGGNQHLRNVKTMFRWGHERGLCFMPVPKFPQIKYQPTKTQAFTNEEVEKLISILNGDFKDMILFGLFTALRPGELRLLQKSQIVKNAKDEFEICIEHHKTSATCKTHRARSIPMIAQTVEIFQRQSQQHPDSPYVFHDRDGKPYLQRIFSQKFKRKCKRAKIPNMPPYSLRHTTANMLAGLGVSEAVAMAILGHSRADTYSRYTKNTQPYHKAAVNLLGNHLSGVFERANEVTTQTDRVDDRVDGSQ